jgi:plastocyanin
MITAPALKIVAIALLSLSLLGCSPDDPLVTRTVTQEVPVENTAPVDDGSPGETERVTTEAELDCLGNPLPDPTEFPLPADDITRPDDKIVDLRGQARVEVEIRDNVFEPRWIRVDPCTEIVFVNRGANPHNVVPAAEGAFPMIDQFALFDAPQALVLSVPGNYPYYCSIHGTPTRGQTGYIVVGDN